MNQPRLSQLNIWGNHEMRVSNILLEALSILQKKKIQLSENCLNRELFLCLLEANRKLWRSAEGGFDYPPTREGQNPPDPDDDCSAKREKKIPDFYWSYVDHLVADPKRSARHFYIECKRLGRPPRADWILNENYINHGVLRFVTTAHGYAQGEASAAMVGYVQSMKLSEILREVNSAAIAKSIPILVGPIGGWKGNGISKLEHDLDRPFRISPLKLGHFWVDLRESELA